MDLIQLLKKDHEKVKHLFEQFEKLSRRSAQKKHALVEQLHKLLSAHAQLEEELVYPVLKELQSDEMTALIQEAYGEHKVTKTLLAELGELQSDDEHYHVKVMVMGEYMQHHVKEEEKEMLPLAQKHLSQKRMAELSTAVEARHHELMDGDHSQQQAT